MVAGTQHLCAIDRPTHHWLILVSDNSALGKRVANIFFKADGMNLREAGLARRTEVPYSYGGPQLMAGDRSRIDVALCSTAMVLTSLLFVLAAVMWIGAR